MKWFNIISKALVLMVVVFTFSSHSQAVNQVTFRVPVQIQNINYLSSVNVSCKIQDGTRDDRFNQYIWTNAHTIHNLVKKWIWDPNRYPACLEEPKTGQAATSCADVSPDGLSWSNIVEVTVRDFESGGIRVDQGAQYKCITVVHYDTEPESAGEAALSDDNCAGFYNNPFSKTARERYKTYTGGDIAEASLCVKTEFNPSLNVIDVAPQYIRGGEYSPPAEITPPAEVNTSDTTPPKPVATLKKPNVSVQDSKIQVMQKMPATAVLQQKVGDTNACGNAVQGKIAWNYKGNKQWGINNINSLCAGAENSVEPALCFDKVMHGGVDWGGGTKWEWGNALNLCKGSHDANATIACFEKAIKVGKGWKSVINSCSSNL